MDNANIEYTNKSDAVLTDFSLYATAVLLDRDGIFLSHGPSFGKKTNEFFLGSNKIFKPEVTTLDTYSIDWGIGEDKSKCSEISTVEFSLTKASCKDRRGEDLDCDSFLDKTVTLHKMSDLVVFDW